MACGTPVVCSAVSSLPEVAGDAALLITPDDAAGIAAAIRRVLEEPGLAAAMREKGLRRAAEFSWRRLAEKRGPSMNKWGGVETNACGTTFAA